MIDAHTHLDLPAFDHDREAVVARARAAGVTGFVIAGADPVDAERVERTATALGVPWTVGVHPWWLADLDDEAADRAFASIAARSTPHGIGETGLDHARARTDPARARQLRLFRAHLALARERNVPVVLHVVRAYPQALRVIARDGLPEAGGLVHAWAGPAELVPTAVRLGLHLSFGPSIAREGRAADSLTACPADHVLIETDSPDQALDGPGVRGEPADLARVAATASKLRDGLDVGQIAAGNARRLFPALATVPGEPAGLMPAAPRPPDAPPAT